MVNDLPLAASEIQKLDMLFINIGADRPCLFLYLNLFFLFFGLSYSQCGCDASNTASITQDRKNTVGSVLCFATQS